MDYQNVIDRIHGQLQELWGQGRVADYIPALAKVDPRQFGIAGVQDRGRAGVLLDSEYFEGVYLSYGDRAHRGRYMEGGGA